MNKEKREKLLTELGVDKNFAKEAWKNYSGNSDSWKDADRKSLKEAIKEALKAIDDGLKEKAEALTKEEENDEEEEQDTPLSPEEKEMYAATLRFQDRVIYCLENGIPLDNQDLREIPWSFCEEDREAGENRRWSRSITSYFSYEKDGEKKYFALDWEEGLTEMQENEFYSQPYFVTPREITETITRTVWDEVPKQEEQEEGEEEEEER